jgi:hypothetical protein
MSEERITVQEIKEMFGDNVPLEAVEAMFCDSNQSMGELRANLKNMGAAHRAKQQQVISDPVYSNDDYNHRFREFQCESNMIEDIVASEECLQLQTRALRELCENPLTIASIEAYVLAVQPDAFLRTNKGDEVSIMGFDGLAGGLAVSYALQEIIDGLDTTENWYNYVRYELLHPFSDGNGRSGRAVWLYYMLNTMGGWQYVSSLGFLDTFHRQVLYAFSRQSMTRTPEEVVVE